MRPTRASSGRRGADASAGDFAGLGLHWGAPNVPETLPIRLLATLFASLLLAVGLAFAAWSGFLALRRGAARTVATVPAVVDLPKPPAPERLGADPAFGREPVEASFTRGGSPTVPLSIRIRNVPADLHHADAGIATFAAATGSDFVWTPLSTATPSPDGCLLVASTSHPDEEVVVTLASSRAFARHGYLARTSLRVARGAPAPEVQVDVAVSTVSLGLPPRARHAGPLRLTRVDDPHWLPMNYGPTGITLRANAPVTLSLGAGEYELSDPIAPERRQRFTVPSAEAIVLSAELAPPATDRP